MQMDLSHPYQRLWIFAVLIVSLVIIDTMLHQRSSDHGGYFMLGLQNAQESAHTSRTKKHTAIFCEDDEIVVTGFTVHNCDIMIRSDPFLETSLLDMASKSDCDINGRYVRNTDKENQSYYVMIKSHDEFLRYIIWDPEGPYWTIGFRAQQDLSCALSDDITCEPYVLAHSEKDVESPELAQEWFVQKGSGWGVDYDVTVAPCVDICEHIKVHNSLKQFLNGEYSYESDMNDKPRYHLFSNGSEVEHVYLYYGEDKTWNFGRSKGPLSWAYVESTAEYPSEASGEWNIWNGDVLDKGNIKISCVQRRPGVNYLTCVQGCELSVGQTVVARRDIKYGDLIVESGDVGEVVCGKAGKGIFVDWNSLQGGGGVVGKIPCAAGCGLPGLSKPTGGWTQCNALRTEEVSYLLPEVNFGTNNERMMFASAAVLATEINRTLVLPHFAAVHNAFWPYIPFRDLFDEDEIASVLNFVSFEHFRNDCRNAATLRLLVPEDVGRRSIYEDHDITVLHNEDTHWGAKRIKKLLRTSSCAILSFQGFGRHLDATFDPEYSYIWSKFIPSKRLRDIGAKLMQPYVDKHGTDYLALHYRYGDNLDKQNSLCERRIKVGAIPGWVHREPVQSNMFGKWIRPVTYKNCMINVDDVVAAAREIVEEHDISFVFLATDAPRVAPRDTVGLMKQLFQLDVPVVTIHDLAGGSVNECGEEEENWESEETSMQMECLWQSEIGLIDQWLLIQAEHFVGSFLSTFSGVAAMQRIFIHNKTSSFFGN